MTDIFLWKSEYMILIWVFEFFFIVVSPVVL